MKLTVGAEPHDGGDARRLVAALDAELEGRYADFDVPPEVDLPALNRIDGEAVFLVARLDGEAVGCGALRPRDDGAGEVKRMYVAPSARGRGVGRAVLDALMAAGEARGYRRLVLETGIRQGEAMALYEAAGWQLVPAYGVYRLSPFSRCYERSLGSSPA